MEVSSLDIEGGYQPNVVEEKWVKIWNDSELYRADAKHAENDSPEKRFVMVIPPPNVTGRLHLGHTMMAAIEDSITRWNRMLGKHTCWVPGTDHAGIATQSVVERALMRDHKLSRHDLGREAFVQKIKEWKDQTGGTILYQLRRLGCSCDWSREAFTMDDNLSAAVVEAFVTLHDRGLIYRAERLVSWSPYLNTALSEIEVDTDEIEQVKRITIPGFDKTVEVGSLWHFNYPLKKDPTRFIQVATTRLETMLGDVAVAVNPNDPRYKDIIGEELIHPFIADREMRVIGDDHCDADFGTGAVKITPAHDKNDFEIGKRHKLPFITIFTLDGHINEVGGTEFAGMHRFEARLAIEKALKEKGLMGEKVKNSKKMALPRCSRSNDIVEYMIVPQWYVACDKMAKRAADAVRSRELELLPDSARQQWFYWLDNIRDWCVSRQLWWGHRIPAYRIVPVSSSKEVSSAQNEQWVVGRSKEEARERAIKMVGEDLEFTLEQDEDVLDTWFSSGLFPFSVFGWPNVNSEDLKAFFPTTLLETGSDILFFWVARMVMMSLELCDVLPFKTVFLHPMVRDSHGKKMSKSLGNVVDPVDVIKGISLEQMSLAIKESNLKESEIKRALDAQSKDFPKGIEECGADALRFGLLAYLSGGTGVNLDINRVIGYKHFCNKLWNATKFAMTYFKPAVDKCNFRPCWANLDKTKLQWADRWILHRSSICAVTVNEAMSKYDLEAAVSATYSFWLYNFCDIYLELVKTRLSCLYNTKKARPLTSDETTALQIIFTVMERGFRLLHPFMPFITEELWQRLMAVTDHTYYKPKSIAIADYPTKVNAWENTYLDEEMDTFMEVVKHFRSMLAQFDVPPKVKLAAMLRVKWGSIDFLQERAEEMKTLAKLRSLRVVWSWEKFEPNMITNVINEKWKSGLDPEQAVDFGKVEKKLQKRLDQVVKGIEAVEKKMAIPDYESKAPEDIKIRNAESLVALTNEKASLLSAISNTARFRQTTSTQSS